MTIPNPGLNIYFPSADHYIYQQQTSAQHDLQNRADMGKGNVVIVPQSDTDLVPLSKLAERNTWQYRSESDRPTLKQMGRMFGAGAEPPTHDFGWEANYNELTGQENIQELLQGDPTLSKGSLQFVMELGARAMDWQDNAAALSNSENAQARATINLHIGAYTFSGTVHLGNELTQIANQWLQEIGPNDPDYLAAQQFNSSLKSLLNPNEE